MQRIIQINLAGRVIAIEEDAYLVLRDYIHSLERLFAGEKGKDEILQDIESRMAELFFIRLEGGAPSIDRNDVRKVIDTLGHAEALGGSTGNNAGNPTWNPYLPVPYEKQQGRDGGSKRRLYRNPDDRILGGVCSGLGSYFDIDPVIIRIIWAVLLLIGVGFLAYIIAWIVIPPARTPQEVAEMTGGPAVNFHTFSRNLHEEMQDLKQRGEQMSRELQDFFRKKK